MANRLPAIFLTLIAQLMGERGLADTLTGIVDTDGTPLPDTVVTATPTAQNPYLPKSKAAQVTMRLDQKRKEFIPHVLPIRAGTAVFFPNSDEIQHHVYSFSPAKRFEIKLYIGTPAKPVIFDQPGVVSLGCNIHDWMLGFIYVTDTPYFTKSDSEGRWSLNVPEGEYRVTYWHSDAVNAEQRQAEIVRTSSKQALHQNIAMKIVRQSGKPPATLQLEGYSGGF